MAQVPLAAALFILIAAFSQAQAEGDVLVLGLDGAITPASDDMVAAAIEEAVEGGFQALVLTLNTPGGGLEETLEIIEQIEGASIPVIGFVYPQGAKAWSAGTLILIGSDIAAMSPYSIIGSAQPVRLSPTGGTEPINDTKTTNAIVALISEKASMHSRNTTAARDFVLENLNLNADEALEYGVVEHVSSDVSSLLQDVDGTFAKNRTLATQGANVIDFRPPPRLYVLKILSDPMISGLLMLIGLYALIFGISNPGLGAEAFGVVALALGLIGMGFDVNLGALFLILLGMGLIIAEIHSNSFGVLGAAGLICIVAGSVLFAPVGYPQWYLPAGSQRSMIMIFLIPSVVMGLFFAFAAYKVAQARLRPAFSQIGEGEQAEALENLSPKGRVLFRGEYWSAEADGPVAAGERVFVVGQEGSLLKVKRKV